MKSRLLPLPAALAATGLLLTGCGGLTNPYATTRTRALAYTARSRASASDHDPGPERGGSIPKVAARQQTRLATTARQASPVAAIRRYLELYINWTAADVSAQQRKLASISFAAARAQALQAAASYRHDGTLAKSEVANSGTVIAIARGEGLAAGDWVIVTSETTTGKGDYEGLPAQIHVTYAQLAKTKTGWVISSWSPQI
jgi:hypothetical protein